MAAEVNTIHSRNYGCSTLSYYPVVIIGAGGSGIAAGCQLKRKLGFEQFRIYERRSGIGGVWYGSRYPGVAGDLPAQCYSFSFFRKKSWTKPCPPGVEILQYMIDTCRKFGIASSIRLNTEVESVRWIEADLEWELRLRHLIEGAGDLTTLERNRKLARDPHSVLVSTEMIRTKAVMSCVGAAVEPKSIPPIPGEETFRGTIVRSTSWRHDINVRDKNVVVVGTGTIGSQIVPALIRPEFGARSVVNLMESPSWDEVFCSRRVTGDDWFDSLKDTRVELSEFSLLAVRDRSVFLGGSDNDSVRSERDADVIVFANGLGTGQWSRPLDVIGRDNCSLRRVWQERGGPKAYLGCVVDGFPNLFIISGPHMVTGQSGIMLASERIIEYALRFIPRILSGEINACEINADAEARYTAEVRERLKKTAWTGRKTQFPNHRDWRTEYSRTGLRKYKRRLGLGMPAKASERTAEDHTVSAMQRSEDIQTSAPTTQGVTEVLDAANFSHMTSGRLGRNDSRDEHPPIRPPTDGESTFRVIPYDEPRSTPERVFNPVQQRVPRKPVPTSIASVIQAEQHFTPTSTSLRLLSGHIFDDVSEEDISSESRSNSLGPRSPPSPLEQTPSHGVVIKRSSPTRPRKPVPYPSTRVIYGDEKKSSLTAVPSFIWLSDYIR